MINYLYSYYLYFLPILLLPILIHLFYRKKYADVYFSNVRLLKEAVLEFSFKKKLKNIFLLLIRLLILLFLILLFAEPVKKNDVTNYISKNYPVLIVIDNSYSMSAVNINEKLFEKAVKDAELFLDKIEKGISIAVIPAVSYDDEKIIFSKNKTDAYESLKKIKIKYNNFKIKNIIDRLKNNYIKFPLNIIIFTDVQKNNFDNFNNDDKNLITVIDVSSKSIINKAIVKVKPLNQISTNNIPIKFDIDIYSNQLSSSTQMSGYYFKLGQKIEFYKNKIKLDNKINNITFSHTFNETQTITGYFEIGSDNIQYDNIYSFNISVLDIPNILYIYENQNADKITELFLKNADSKIKNIQLNKLTEIEPKGLKKYNILIINGINKIDYDSAKKIKNYVYSGGTVLFLLGDKLDINNYNNMLGRFYANEEPFLPGEIIKFQNKKTIFNNLNNSLAYFKIFNSDLLKGLTDINVNNYYSIRPFNNSVILVGFNNTLPAIISKPSRKGKVVLFAYNHSKKTGAFYTSPLYYSIFNQIILGNLGNSNLHEYNNPITFNSLLSENKFVLTERELKYHIIGRTNLKAVFNFNSEESEIEKIDIKTIKGLVSVINEENYINNLEKSFYVFNFNKYIAVILLVLFILNFVVSNYYKN